MGRPAIVGCARCCVEGQTLARCRRPGGADALPVPGTRRAPSGRVSAALVRGRKEIVMNRTIVWSLGLTVVATLVAEAGAAPRKTCSATADALYVACKAQTI